MILKANAITRFLKNCLQTVGLAEKRCAQCLYPFTPNVASDLLCPACALAISPYAGFRCKSCGLPLPQAARHNPLCPECRHNPPPWQDLAYYGLYEGLLRDMLLRLKFDGELHLSHLLASFLLDAAGNLPRPDVVVALPQYPGRLRIRGFNQAHEIARSFCRMSGFSLSHKILRRIRSGLPQEGLSAVQRRQNIANAFQADNTSAGLNIWLVDDIMTTGATCREACDTLLKAGARSVSLLFVARTPRII